MNRVAPAAFCMVALSGCSFLPARTVYLSPPEAYLQPCAIPALPVTTGELSQAFAQAVMCAKQGNDDKAAIRAHLEERRRQ